MKTKGRGSGLAGLPEFVAAPGRGVRRRVCPPPGQETLAASGVLARETTLLCLFISFR